MLSRSVGRLPLAAAALLLGLLASWPLACSDSSSTFQGGGRMLEPPGSGDDAFGLESADTGTTTGGSDASLDLGISTRE